MKRSFFQAAVFVDTAISMHYMDANKNGWRKARRQLHKNAASHIEQVPGGNTQQSNQLYGHLPPIT